VTVRFRRTVKVAPGVRVNFTKTGIGVRLGPRGLGLSAHSSGRVTAGAGIPGPGCTTSRRARWKPTEGTAAVARVRRAVPVRGRRRRPPAAPTADEVGVGGADAGVASSADGRRAGLVAGDEHDRGRQEPLRAPRDRGPRARRRTEPATAVGADASAVDENLAAMAYRPRPAVLAVARPDVARRRQDLVVSSSAAATTTGTVAAYLAASTTAAPVRHHGTFSESHSPGRDDEPELSWTPF
jgi:hypothetical protein